jgi:hypothetical protein
MSQPAIRPGSGRWHFIGILLVTIIVMVLGVAVVVAPDRMGVPDFSATPVATPVATVP